MIDLRAFKNSIFSGNELNTTEIAVLFYIFVQDRKKFVFYKNMMMNALNIKDIRTLNHAIDSLIKKGFIHSAVKMFRNVKGFIFSIIGVDVEQDQQQELNECSRHDSIEKGFDQETSTDVARNETSEHLNDGVEGVPPRAAAVENVSDVKHEISDSKDNVSDVEHAAGSPKLQNQNNDRGKYPELVEISEMNDDDRATLEFLRQKFC